MDYIGPGSKARVNTNRICFVILKISILHWPIAALMSCIVRIHWTFMPHSQSTLASCVELGVPQGSIAESFDQSCLLPSTVESSPADWLAAAHAQKLPTHEHTTSFSCLPGAPTPPAMDSPVVTQLFRQLFRHGHPACQSRRNLTNLASAIHQGRQLRQLRALSSEHRRRGALSTSEKERHWQQRSNVSPADRTEDLKRYPTVTAKDLRSYRERPRRVKMLMRDFIEG